MALTYRGPIEEIVGCFEPAVQSAIASTAANGYKTLEEENFHAFNLALSAIAKEKLSKAGIYLSPYSGVPHSHPVCKTLENYMLFSVLPSIIDNRFTFVGIKNFKLDFLKARVEKKGKRNVNLIESINRYVTSADKIRYGNDFVIASSKPCKMLKRHAPLLGKAALRELIPECVQRRAKHLFMHDEIHYWDARDLCGFLEVVRPETLLATLVYPPELLSGAKESLNRWCYTFEIKDSNLLFYPDGVRSEGYVQPLRNGFLLKANRIVLADGTVYGVGLICSKFAHHLVAITKGSELNVDYRSFGPFEAVACNGLSKMARKVNGCFPVSFDLVSRVYRYLRTLKKPDVQSAMAKLGQLVPEPNGAEIKFVEEFSKLVIRTNTINSTICADHAKLFLGNMLGCLPGIFLQTFGVAREVNLDSFVAALEPYTFTLKMTTIDDNYKEVIDFLNFGECEEGYDLVSAMDSKLYGPRIGVLNRTQQPYVGLAPVRDEKKVLLQFTKEQALRALVFILHKSFNDSYQIGISKPLLKRWLREVRSKQRNLWCKHIDELLVDEAELTRVCKRVLAKGIPKNRPYMPKRLEAVPTRCAVPREAKLAYSCVVSDILRRGAKWGAEELAKKLKIETPLVTESAHNIPPPEPVEAEVVHEPLVCGCNEDLSYRTLPHAGLIHEYFPDKLRNREAAWYAKNGTCYRYSDITHQCLGWPNWIEKWAEVNDLDISGYDCLLAQRYREGGAIGFHADDECIFETGGSILTVNIKGRALFSLAGNVCRKVWELNDGECFTMPCGFQQTHKHAVSGCSEGRISFTFRKLKTTCVTDKPAPETPQDNASDDGANGSQSIEKPVLDADTQMSDSSDSGGELDSVASNREPSLTYEVGCVEFTWQPAELSCNNFKFVKVNGDGNCFWYTLEHFTGVNQRRIKEAARTGASYDSEFSVRLAEQLQDRVMAEEEAISAASYALRARLVIYDFEKQCIVSVGNEVFKQTYFIGLSNEHFSPVLPVNDCLAVAIAAHLDRKVEDVINVLSKQMDEASFMDLWCGKGVDVSFLPLIFEMFNIEALVTGKGEDILINAGAEFKGVYDIVEEHITYLPERKVPHHQVLNTNVGTKGVNKGSLQLLRGSGTMLDYAPEMSRALRLAKNLFQGRTGAISSGLFNDKASLEPDVHNGDFSSRAVCVVLGTFGAGKSTLFKKFMQANKGKCVHYVSPRRGLADDFASAMGIERGPRKKLNVASQNWRVNTFEKFIAVIKSIGSGAAVIIDEIQLYPPGYLDICLALLERDVHIFLVGDPCQSDYDSEKDRASYAFELSDIEMVLKEREYRYNIMSRRFQNANLVGRLPCYIDQERIKIDESYLIYDRVEDLADLPDEYRDVILVSSFDEKKIVESYTPDAKQILTFGESTGRNFRCGCILVTEASKYTSEKRWITALSRFSRNVAFVNATSTSFEQLLLVYKGKVLADFLCKRSTEEFFTQILPGKPVFRKGFSNAVGKDEGIMEEKLQGDPWLKTMIDLLQIEDIEETLIDQEEMQKEWFKTHLPQCELESVRARWVHKILAKEHREKRIGCMISEQFTEEHSKEQGVRLTNACERFETIYPRHRANDTVTFLMAVKKRLRFSDPNKERAKMHEAGNYGRFLLKEFLKKVPLRQKHNKELMAQAKADFEAKKTAKSAATIENHAGRSCRDWLADIGLVFSKSQICTKYDNRFRSAKAAQTIVCFSHAVLCRFAPYMRYIEYKLKEVLPEKYYIHSGKGLEELNDWVIKGRFDDVCTESDYEAFDASQDQYIVAFEIEVMRYLGLPADLIADYLYIKTHLGSKLGNFAIMRFSGEASTFLFNTMANMLFTFLRYEIKGRERICFAGDDMCANTKLVISREHEWFLGKLKLKAKVENTKRPTFCGWNLCSDGIYKKPQLVLERMCIAKETNNLHNCIDNYAIEVSYAYLMGERAVCRMNEEELEAYYNCVRIIIKNKHLLKSDVREVFQEVC
ncbi:unnamed protein product [american hop latent virus]|uniref:Viral replicase n=1 Tax=american hop latent virus TaxID=3158378 RepID=I1W5T2_9VIRU|nr:unnamed protein product [American hop latent virus]AFI61519.1 putative viral replicase [American hop latent virus]